LRREQATRVPNAALAFRPSPDLLARTGQTQLTVGGDADQSARDPRQRAAFVWRFQNGRFVPVELRIGLADDSWTEVVGGGVAPGDRLVTAAKRSKP
jgi:HlyD family secretion protein